MPNKAIFLDRDDTLIEDPGYINDPDQVKLLDGVPKALTDLRDMGYKLIIVSNQSAVARGIVTEQVLAKIHERLKQLLAEKDACIDKIYYCPCHIEGTIEKYRKESDLRKPNPGMLLTAAKEMDIDLTQSWMVGDSIHDVQAGLRAGCRTILIDNPTHETKTQPGRPRPDFRAVNIKEAVNIIKKHARTTNKRFGNNDSSQHAPTTVEIETAQKTTPAQTETEQTTRGRDNSAAKNQILLQDILDQLKTMERSQIFTDFSVTRLLAGAIQIIALFCLLISLWLLMSPDRQTNSILIALGFAVFLQLMSLTLYMMQGRKH